MENEKQTRSEIQKRSDQKRGVRVKSYTMPLTLVAEIEQLAQTLGITRAKVIEQGVALLKIKTEKGK